MQSSGFPLNVKGNGLVAVSIAIGVDHVLELQRPRLTTLVCPAINFRGVFLMDGGRNHSTFKASVRPS